ncbi:MAG: exodeoxyribonuclease VII small subunit [Bacteroidales bacterium]|jgi:exodeoxyribonuclease VII small subunit|nr:exodeoxyribonuclease VII small subunit [Bacteroidales bacterium]MDZ4059192.1 exodeoxyribonuclease VII small subunit [Bacteroidales bacterium]
MEERNNLTYLQALKELEVLAQKIENPETPLENIAEEVKKALDLINFCKEQIKGYREETESLLK